MTIQEIKPILQLSFEQSFRKLSPIAIRGNIRAAANTRLKEILKRGH